MRNNAAFPTHPQARFDEDYVSPDLFNRHVTPDLVAAIQGYACFVRLDMCSWTEAFDQVMTYAWRRGAFGFSSQHLHDLLDWVGRELAQAIDTEAP